MERSGTNTTRPIKCEAQVFQANEFTPRIEGRETIMKSLRPFISNAAYIEFEMLRSMVIGKTVINDRIDRFDAGDGVKKEFHISGFFFVVDGKIKEGRDYTWLATD